MRSRITHDIQRRNRPVELDRMRPRKLGILLLAAAPLIACAADESIARLTQIDGQVLLSVGSSMASATATVRLAPGMRVLTTQGSSAEIVFDDGCRVRLGSRERYEVDRTSPCGPDNPGVDSGPQSIEDPS